MRGPQGTPFGKLRRVIINNIIAYNADAHFASINAGLPGNDIEDIQLSNIRIYYRPIDSPLSKIQTVFSGHERTYPQTAKNGSYATYVFLSVMPGI